MCKMLCPEGEEFHPLANCECRSVEEIREVYPDWASDLDIKYASDAGMDRFWNKKDETPSGSCAEYMKCSSGFYVNELACACFSLA